MVRVIYPHEILKEKLGIEPIEVHELDYDSNSSTLEPVYFWVVDTMVHPMGMNPEKLVDNFVSSPGSGHFGELQARATRMQEEGMKILGTINTIIKSIINLVYDLRQWEIKLSHYNDLRTGDKDKKEAALLALKQTWMDNVDVKRGRGSINMLTYDMSFVTLRDAFMTAKDAGDVDKMDLNDRVKRILKPRINEFNEWLKRSEKELRKRFEIEKSYLKSQVNSLKLYSRWAKPYLRAASELEMSEKQREPSLVKAFNTVLLELTLFGKSEISIEQAAVDKSGRLPYEFKDHKMKREYYACSLVDLTFRGIPQRIGQQGHYAFGGRVDVKFRSYALNNEELEVFYNELEKADIDTMMEMVSGITEDSLDALKEDLDKYIEDAEKEPDFNEQKEKKSSQDNPFLALVGWYNQSSKKPKPSKQNKKITPSSIKKDNHVEKMVREVAAENAKDMTFKLFDYYKKAHQMPSYT